MSNGRVIRQLSERNGQDNLLVVMIIEEEDLGEKLGTNQVIIPESTETGKRLWRWAQREGKVFPFSPAAFEQPAGIKARRLNTYTQAARESRIYPIPQDHCIISVGGFGVILANQDLYELSHPG